MKNLLILLCCSFAALQLTCQQLGFSTFSSIGNPINTDHEVYRHSAGEPINERKDITFYSIKQGVMQGVIEPQSSLGTIQVRFFLDENEDGRKNASENFIDGGSFTIDDTGYTIFKPEGIIFDAPRASYNIAFKYYKRHFLLTTDSLVTVTIDDLSDYVSVNFGLKPDRECVEPAIKMTSDRFRCFDQVTYDICVMNNGCVAYIDTVYVEIDNRLDPDSIYFQDTPDLILSDHEVGWIVEVSPGEIVQLSYSVAAPMVDDPSDLGVIYKSRAWVEIDENTKAEECFEQELRCSYDPNDKAVSPGREDELALVDELLYYTIRFQNTGNDYAEDVLVIDTLSQSLDINTLQLINTSHPRELEIQIKDYELNIVHFRYDNIFLPDSTTNEPGSNGKILFSIVVVDGLELETEIENTAHIYFDRNPAIVTNTVKSIMVDEFPVDATRNFNPEVQIAMYPNPTSGMLYLSEHVDVFSMYDLSGRLVKTLDAVDQVDCSELISGVYLLELRKGDQESIQKLELITNN